VWGDKQMRMARLIRLYPAAWRARYGVEYEALLQAQRASPWIVEVMYGALDALDAHAGAAREGMGEQGTNE
jgi:hypothetical protein